MSKDVKGSNSENTPLSGSVTRLIACACLVMLVVGNAMAQRKLQTTGVLGKGEEVGFEVFLPLQHPDELDRLLVALHTPTSPSYHKWLTPDEFQARFGAKPEDIEKVSKVLASYGLTVTSTHSHGLHAQGTAESVQCAFGASLLRARTAHGNHVAIAAQRLQLPAALGAAGAQVSAFSPVIRHRSHSRRVAGLPANPFNRYSAIGPYWFDDLKQAYDFPSYKYLTGKGRTIGIVMAGDFLDSDMKTYFGHEKLNPPTIIRVPVDGGAPFDPNASAVVSLDLQQSGGMAPGAVIVDFNIPDLSDQSILDAYLTIVLNNNVDIVSSSFGGPEGFFTAAYNDGVDFTGILRVFDELFKQGNSQGITFVASSGDNGALGLPPVAYFNAPQFPPIVVGKYLPGIENPADSPHVTAVGGTNLITSYKPPSLASRYVRENAYADPLMPDDPFGVGNLVRGGYFGSGGGPSVIFKKPAYQFQLCTMSKMRTIPDVSLMMGGCPVGTLGTCPDDRSFAIAVIGGQAFGLVGTSISAPDFAGLLALEEENLGGTRLGNVNYQIYGQGTIQAGGFGLKFYHNRIPGFNGLYHTHPTHPGYDLVIGNGTVLGRNFIFAPGVPAAGDPQTPSNP